MNEELKQKAEDFIIDRYKIAECYREDNAETREYMRNDVHSQYEEESQLYIAGATEVTKELEAQIEKMKYALNKIIKTVQNDNISSYGDRLVKIYDISCEVLQEIKEK